MLGSILLLVAVCANALVVELCVCYDGSIARGVALYKLGAVQLHIEDLAAASAEEVGVGMGEAVEVGCDTIHQQHKDCTVLVEQVECVLDGCSRESGDFGRKCRVNLIDGWVCAVGEQIFHHCHSLHRRPYAKFHQVFSCGFHRQ